MNKWLVIENIAIIAAMVLLVYITGSGWWCLMLMMCNTRTSYE